MSVAAELSINSQAISDQTNRLDIVKAGVQTDRALALIETTHNLCLRQQNLYNRQRAALELGYLTESILTINLTINSR